MTPIAKSRRFTAALLSATSTLLSLTASHGANRTDPKSIAPERELFITAPAVVDSAAAHYPNAWSFGGIVEQLIDPKDAAIAVREWLEQWRQPQTINEHIAYPREGILDAVILPWQERDGYDPESEKPWIPKLENAPFRLLAIVNRMDLCAAEEANALATVQENWRRRGREAKFLDLIDQITPRTGVPANFGYGVPSFTSQPERNFGEGRLIFGATDGEGKPLEGDWTIIFEYKLTGRSLLDWAQKWHRLAMLDPQDAHYRDELVAVTKLFTHGSQSDRPRLAQIRTSEASFGSGR